MELAALPRHRWLDPSPVVTASPAAYEDQEVLVLEAGDLWIGRAPVPSQSPDARLVLSDDFMASEQHACIQVAKDAVTIADLGSRNHTFVNGQPVTRSPLSSGDLVRVGGTLLLLREEREPLIARTNVDFIAESQGMRAVIEQLAAFAPHDEPLLLMGETGVGKEVLARFVHERSRPQHPFIGLNCAAISAGLVESELFGHRAHAFTGANTPGLGYFRAAGEGTLLLDEIGDLPLPLQAKLLRVLEERKVTPVGSTQSVSVPARIIAATHHALPLEVASGQFRADLFERLNTYRVEVPPLRTRREEILPILLNTLTENGAPVPTLTPRLAEVLLLHDWPRNIRELRNVAITLGVRAGKRQLLDLQIISDLVAGWGADLASPPARTASKASAPPAPRARPRESPPRSVAPVSSPGIDKAVLDRLLREHQGVIAQVAAAAGRSARQIGRWIKHHGLHRRDYIK